MPLFARDNTSDTTFRINDMIMGGDANVGTTISITSQNQLAIRGDASHTQSKKQNKD